MSSLQRPRLTFACEVDPIRMSALIANTSVIADLQALDARVALMLSDLSDERAFSIQALNRAAIPVIAVPLVSLEEGYYFTADNAPRAAERYEEWKAWTVRHKLSWAGVGLDIEPDAQLYLQLMDNPWRLVPTLISRLFDRARPNRAKAAYSSLVERIRSDGFSVENYQFPLIADERWARSTMLQRMFGLVDVRTDREVWMLYTSVLPFVGPGLLWIYAADRKSVGVGSTGGGPDIPGHPRVPALDWNAFSRDLRLAHTWCNDLLIHSLEGCVEQGYLSRLRGFDWERAETPPATARLAAAFRHVLRGVLWAGARPWPAVGIAAASLWIFSRLR